MSPTRWRRPHFEMDARRTAALAGMGVLVTIVLAVLAISQARSTLEDQLNAQHDQLAQAAEERSLMLARLEDANRANQALQAEVSSLTGQVEALRTQLLSAGLTPVAVAAPSPTTSTSSSQAPAHGAESPTPPPTTTTTTTTTTRPPVACVAGRCLLP